MNTKFSNWIRSFHRWLSVAFTLTVAANFAVRAVGEPPPWITDAPLFALLLMFVTDTYMFVLPYTSRHLDLQRDRLTAPIRLVCIE